MRWPERRLAMLREMGVRVWLPPDAGGHDAAAVPRDEAGDMYADAQADARAYAGEDVDVDVLEREPAPVTARAPAQAPAHAPAYAPVPAPALARSGASEVVLGPRPAGVESMDWAALRAAVSGCTACGLCRTRTNTVFGVGNERAEWMLVGEAPGQQEDQQGEPFVGKAGQLLDNMLRAVGLTRADAPPEQQVFIVNVLKCRPPGNRNPEPQEVAQCEPFLRRQVALVRPRLIVAMGRFAVQSLLQTQDPVGRLRGHVHRYAGVPVVVTYHPAYLLRNPLDKARSWEDLCLAREVMAGTPARG